MAFILLMGFTQCQDHDASPKYVVKVLYSGDSVRYNFDSLPVSLPPPPPNYEDYYKLIHVYTNNTLTIDYTHILKHGKSETFRCFVRYKNGTKDINGWYKRRILNGYIIPANREVIVYHTTPYTKDISPIYSEE